MSVFEWMKPTDINQGVYEFLRKDGALLLDVRTPQEYAAGHIPGSKNIPLQELEDVELLADNKDANLYIYCRSGARSRQAAGLLRHMGYTNVCNIGGIIDYHGRIVA